MSAENYRSATKSHDPGWNDPPKLGYSPGVAPGQTPKLNLNKRIAFPVAGTASPSNLPAPPAAVGGSSLPQFIPAASVGTVHAPSTGQPSVPPLPPMVPTTVGTPPRTGQIDKSKANAAEDGSNNLPTNDEMRDLVRSTLEEFLLKTDSSRQVEIRKRLDVMLQSWNDAKLSDGLRGKLFRLANALNERKTVDANEIHRSIIVEHGKECVQWAPALRQLIQAVPKTAEENLSDVNNVEMLQEPIMKPL